MGYRLSLGELQKGFVAVEKFIQSISEVLSLTYAHNYVIYVVAV